MKKFSPMMYLIALGAGGIAVSGFAFLNYTVSHGKGLITYAQLHAQNFSFLNQSLYIFVEIYMIVFTVIHLVLTGFLLVQLLKWKKSNEYKELLANPIANSSLLIPYVSWFMTFNVILGVVRYFMPILSDNLQNIMLGGLLAWIALWLMMMKLEINILSASFINKFDFSKLNFGWLMQPFALGMATVTGTGIAALAVNPSIAHTAAFVSMISFTMSVFLLLVNSVSLFKNYFLAEKLPDTRLLPSILVVIPILTVLGISLFRYGHYFERQFGAHMGPYFAIVTILTFAFQTWYLFFGLTLLKKYLVQDFRKEYHVSQWGLVCPLVAYAVMGSFVFASFFASTVLLSVIVSIILFFVFIYFYLLIKQFKCNGLATNDNITSCL